MLWKKTEPKVHLEFFDSHTVTGVTDKYEVCSNAYVLLVIIYGGKIVETGRLDLKKRGQKLQN